VNTEQFNSSEFNDISLIRKILSFGISILHSVTKGYSSIKDFGLNVALSLGLIFGFVISYFVGVGLSIKRVGIHVLDYVINISQTIERGFMYTLDYAIKILFSTNWVFAYVLKYFVNISLNYLGIVHKVLNYVTIIAQNILKASIKSFNYSINIIIEHIWGIFLDLDAGIQLETTKLIATTKEFAIGIVQSKTLLIIKIHEFIINIDFRYNETHKLLLDFVVSVGLSLSTSAKWVYLYWRKQLNPDIIGFKILTSDTPYGNFVQTATTTDVFYIKSYLTTGRKWIKVVPYTSRGDLSYILFKSVKL